MRSKEDAHDYRYFPDPDLPPLLIAPEWIAQVRATMPELPAAMAARFAHDDGLPADDAAMMTQSLAFARFYEAARDACGAPKLVANWLMGEISRRLNAGGISIEQCPVTPLQLGELVAEIASSRIHHKQAKQVFEHLWPENITVQLTGNEVRTHAGSVAVLIGSLGLNPTDSAALEKIVDEVLAANPKSVQEYRAGKDRAFNALVGQVMKASQGKANPSQVSELLKRKLAS
jgi:aspartyl-tRNA(Asn)/glutamyl-tRNA(Gln) amidotransferase subunit B